jgi:hypothetical protein
MPAHPAAAPGQQRATIIEAELPVQPAGDVERRRRRLAPNFLAVPVIWKVEQRGCVVNLVVGLVDPVVTWIIEIVRYLGDVDVVELVEPVGRPRCDRQRPCRCGPARG